MLRQIDIDESEARRTAALEGIIVILGLAVPGVLLTRQLYESTQTANQLVGVMICHQPSFFRPGSAASGEK
jgi:hypothetical protein